jgi:hypothetical protein
MLYNNSSILRIKDLIGAIKFTDTFCYYCSIVNNLQLIINHFYSIIQQNDLKRFLWKIYILGPEWPILGPHWPILGPGWPNKNTVRPDWPILGPGWPILGPGWLRAGLTWGRVDLDRFSPVLSWQTCISLCLRTEWLCRNSVYQGFLARICSFPDRYFMNGKG